MTHTTPQTQESARAAVGLTLDEIRQCETLGDRLGANLRMILGALPATCCTVRGASEAFGLDASTCQRLKAAAAKRLPLEVLAYAPGVEALRAFVLAAEKAEVDPQLLAEMRKTVDKFAALVAELGPSHAKLRAKIGRAIEPGLAPKARRQPVADDDELIRRELFVNMAQLMRYQLAGRASITAIGPTATDPDRVELGIISAYLGYRASPGAPPLIAGIFAQSPSGIKRGERQQIGRLGKSQTNLLSGTTVLEHLGTLPTSALIPHGRHGRVLHVIDMPENLRDTPVDLVTASRLEPIDHPAKLPLPQESSFIKQRHPTERMVLDVFLHRSMALASVATGGAILADPRLLEQASVPIPNAWDERVPSRETLQVLGFGLEQAGSTLWPRHAEAAKELFTRMQWRPEDFIGYRLDVRYPLWGAYYYINFDFTPG